MVAQINFDKEMLEQAYKYAEIVIFISKGKETLKDLEFDAMILASDCQMRMNNYDYCCKMLKIALD